MNITAQKAKKISLKLWRYLVDHPEVSYMNYNVPNKIRKKASNGFNDSPLCTYIGRNNKRCSQCPLKNCDGTSLYESWKYANAKEKRKAAAQKIVAAIEAWEIET